MLSCYYEKAWLFAPNLIGESMSRATRPSQRMIADLANVSQAAVSMVVRGEAEANRIPKATQERIENVMREVGYVPNVAARLLRSSRNGLLGVHTYERVFPMRQDDYYHDFLIGIESAAVDRGIDLVLFTSTLQDDGRRAVYRGGMNRLRLADGAIFFGLEKDESELARLSDDGYPFVFIGKRMIAGAEVPSVSADYSGGIRQTVDAVRAAGHRNLLYLASTHRDRPQDERLAAFRAEAAGITSSVVMTEPSAVSSILDDALAGGATAVLVETTELAEELAEALDRLGLRVPDDLSVVVLDSSAPAQRAAAWSHMAIPREEMGRAAVDLLLRRLDEPDAPYDVVLPIEPPSDATIAPLRQP
jgi:DNA-binding LacI/PurR family transcriptional regulator